MKPIVFLQDPPRPNPEFAAFQEALQRDIGRQIGIPHDMFEILSGDRRARHALFTINSRRVFPFHE